MDEHPPPSDRPEVDQPDETTRTPPRRRDPMATLSWAMVVYIFVNLVFALPLVIAPEAYLDAVGLEESVAEQLGGLRWVGAVLLAWAISGILVLARPGGRAFFVTTGALQLTFAAVAFLYSWSQEEYGWSVAYQAFATAVLGVGALIMWWARFASRSIFRGEVL